MNMRLTVSSCHIVGDLSRPVCSRCREANAACVYSVPRRKPGPNKSARRHAAPSHSELQNGSNTATASLPDFQGTPHSAAEMQSIFPEFTYGGRAGPDTRFSTAGSTASLHSLHLELGNYDVRALVNYFFEYVHPSIPLFSQTMFLEKISNGYMHPSLRDTVVAISLRIMKPTPSPGLGEDHNAEAFLDYLLSQPDIDTDSESETSLAEMQQACLLAYYAFHNSPGLRSWTRIGHLTRKAYALGLSQLDTGHSPSTLSAKRPREDASEWRKVWWVIYCLDSYSNITASTPFLVEQASIMTFLTETQDATGTLSGLHLSADPEDVWETLTVLANQPFLDHFAIHICTTLLLRSASALYRLVIQRPPKNHFARVQALQDVMVSARFALPRQYLSTSRMVLSNESSFDFHSRLVNGLLLRMAGILISLAFVLGTSEPELASAWRATMEPCESVVSIVKAWDTQFLTTADPALCFIVSAVLSLLHLYSQCEPNLSQEMRITLERHQNILVLFLRQFSAHWHLPAFLLASYDKFKANIANINFTYADAQHALKLSHGQLTQKRPEAAFQYPNSNSFEDEGRDLSWLDNLDCGQFSLLAGYWAEDLQLTDETMEEQRPA